MLYKTRFKTESRGIQGNLTVLQSSASPSNAVRFGMDAAREGGVIQEKLRTLDSESHPEMGEVRLQRRMAVLHGIEGL